MLYLTVFIIFLTILLLLYSLFIMLYKNKILMQNRMEQIENINIVNRTNLENLSFSERAIMPFYNSVSKLFLKMTSSYKLSQLQKKLERAGLNKSNTPEKWMFNKLIFSVILSILFGMLSYSVDPDILKVAVITIVIQLLINTIFKFYLSSRISQRKNMILMDLPYTLDLITVSVEAGLSFDGAIARVINNISGVLCDEFGKTLKEIRMGIERKLALRNMSERCEVRELSTLLTSLIQADELGVSLGKVLRIEAAQLREHRKQVAREKAMKAPIKMLFPLMFFIFPAIFIIILGPALIQIFEIF